MYERAFRIRLRILLFSSVTFKMPIANKKIFRRKAQTLKDPTDTEHLLEMGTVDPLISCKY